MEPVIAMNVVKRPELPSNFFRFPVSRRLKAVEQFISSFEYKGTPETNFNSQKFRPLVKLMDTARNIVYSPQPIKCVEAVFVALYLTAGLLDVDRFPVGFRTELDSAVYRHIILVVRHGAKYGAFGISREATLMNKDFEFDSLSSIVENFKASYEKLSHTVLDFWIGLPVEHNVSSYNFVCWRYLTLSPVTQSWKECCEGIETHAAQAKRLWERWLIEGASNSTSIKEQLKAEKDAKTKPAWSIKGSNGTVKHAATSAARPGSTTRVGFGDKAVVQFSKRASSAQYQIRNSV